MRKLIFFLALLLPFISSKVDEEDKNVVKKIPIIKVEDGIGERSLNPIPFKAFYYSVCGGIMTYVNKDFGKVEITVLNSTTGDSWSDSFDSSQTRTHLLNISGEECVYEVTYITKSGDVYQGSFHIE